MRTNTKIELYLLEESTRTVVSYILPQTEMTSTRDGHPIVFAYGFRCGDYKESTFLAMYNALTGEVFEQYMYDPDHPDWISYTKQFRHTLDVNCYAEARRRFADAMTFRADDAPYG